MKSGIRKDYLNAEMVFDDNDIVLFTDHGDIISRFCRALAKIDIFWLEREIQI